MSPATRSVPVPDTTVVTGSDRLARHLVERAADERLQSGQRAWERPDVLPAGAFWRRLADELRFEPGAGLARRRVLSRNAVLARFEALLAERLADRPLLQVAGAARAALEAWQLARDWRLDIDALAADPLEETRLMVDCGRAFESECANNGLLPDYALPDAVLATLEQLPGMHARLPARIELAGFLDMSPTERDRWNALAVLGVDVAFLPSPDSAANAGVVACADGHAEIAAAAAWARRLLGRDPRQRIAIVVPDLAARRASLKRALIEALAPERLRQFDDAPLPFNFSLGEPLANVALVADALAWLALADGHVDFVTAARLCRSPYFAAEGEVPARRRLEAVMRREGYAEFSLRDWRSLAARRDCPVLASALETFGDAVRRDSGDALPSVWARRFNAWLADAGWCRARALDSAEFQAREAWHELLGRLAEFDVVLGRVPRAVAMGWLQRLAGETLFQPRAADAPVQVLGLLEATGMRFDAVWVMGLNDDALPAAPRPNPFLPVELQRAKKLPHASAARELAFARELLHGLVNAAPEVVLSWARREADAELAPSPLLAAFPGASPPEPCPDIAHYLYVSRAHETYVDARAPAHPGGHVAGGTALLQNQSHCPFRAFAVHRLEALDWPTPQRGPDALLRGLVAHRVLERLWREWRSSTRLHELHERGELAAAVQRAVADVVTESAQRARHRWPPAQMDIEIERLTGVLLRWFENIELPRRAFTVSEVEGVRLDGSEVETRLRAGPLELAGKLDRVDVLGDGSELIIDYKTGAAPGKGEFFGERPHAPQLPAYLVARRQAGLQTPAGIAVASLKTGRENLQGVMRGFDESHDPGIAGLVNVAKTKQVADWDEAIAHWEHVIDALGNAFARGDANVDPLRGACDYCHLAALCRIHEQEREAELGDE